MHSQGQKAEAFDLAKIALRNNMKSHVTWHVYGLLYRGEKNFEEAIKAYKFALKLEPESQPIQRDLAHLQIQMRDYEGYTESRRRMLQQKPGFRQNWTALAIAHHLSGDYDAAENVLTTYEDTLKTKPGRSDTEHWEAVLYKNYIIAESGQTEKALEHLEAMGERCPDVLGVMEMRAAYLLKLGRNDEAAVQYSTLLDRNPDNSAYYDGYIQARGLQEADGATAKQAYDEIAARHPRSDLPRRRPLDFLAGDAFRAAADTYLTQMLRKGVPSTFANVKHLYSDSAKLQIIQELVLGYESNSAHVATNGSSDADEKATKSFEWSVPYFLAQHYNYKLSRDLSKALEYAEKCIALDPKSVDFHAARARTYKYMGAISKAASEMVKAQELDLKDRAINTKATKYLLRDQMNDQALQMAGKFTQNKTAGGPLADLLDMQCVWFLVEDGSSYLQQRKLGMALKRFHQILAIFEVWQDDQFDFHNFSLRKGMIRAYIDMLRWEDHLRDHPYFSQMAVLAVKAYILLHDEPDLVHGPLPQGVNGSINGKMTDAEKKKAIKKAKKEQEKLEKAEADKKALAKASKPTPKADADETKKEDTDPIGKTLLETKQPLEDAMKFLAPLLEFCPGNLEAQKVAFEVQIRRGKYLLATKALLAMKAIAPDDSAVHVGAYRLRAVLESGGDSLENKVADYVRQIARDVLRQGTPAKDVNEDVMKGHKASIRHLQVGVRVAALIDPQTRTGGERKIVASADEFPDATLSDLAEGLELLHKIGAAANVVEEYSAAARKRWPEADVFKSEKQA